MSRQENDMNSEIREKKTVSSDNEDRQVYELISLGIEDPQIDRDELAQHMKQRFAFSDAEVRNLIDGGHTMGVMFRMQALHVARELNRMGIRTEIRRKSE
jgi:hypothetical protein